MRICISICICDYYICDTYVFVRYLDSLQEITAASALSMPVGTVSLKTFKVQASRSVGGCPTSSCLRPREPRWSCQLSKYDELATTSSDSASLSDLTFENDIATRARRLAVTSRFPIYGSDGRFTARSAPSPRNRQRRVPEILLDDFRNASWFVWLEEKKKKRNRPALVTQLIVQLGAVKKCVSEIPLEFGDEFEDSLRSPFANTTIVIRTPICRSSATPDFRASLNRNGGVHSSASSLVSAASTVCRFRRQVAVRAGVLKPTHGAFTISRFCRWCVSSSPLGL
ncbi:PREDICTED: uncharacterized protein LOC106748635 [Dinoponera quadriceps]|uniref:Uncharacterized protein LOC106748635 n=1 Tax=Dinoponera quadriceps TaxID=609295 RepID=A0A6P3XXL2_DINQU|nr:PREDICTED: uncharacterized protein LOC106748635 [Dinoponera quadriceps]